MEDTLRRIVREETRNAVQQYAGLTLSQVREIVREELGVVEKRLDLLEGRLDSLEKRVEDGFTWVEEQFEWVVQRFDAMDKRLDAVDRRLDAVGDAVVLLAQNLPGSIPGKDSHIVRKVRKTLRSGGPPTTGKIAAKGGS